jgi:hypothetical protein
VTGGLKAPWARCCDAAVTSPQGTDSGGQQLSVNSLIRQPLTPDLIHLHFRQGGLPQFFSGRGGGRVPSDFRQVQAAALTCHRGKEHGGRPEASQPTGYGGPREPHKARSPAGEPPRAAQSLSSSSSPSSKNAFAPSLPASAARAMSLVASRRAA